MKKSLVVLLAVVFTLAIASATIAADISVWSGGDMYFYLANDEQGMLESPGTFTLLNITAQVTNGNTWAKFWLNADKWRYIYAGNPTWYFSFGANKIGDVLDLGFTTKDNGNCNLGQVAITDQFNTFHADQVFTTYPIENWTAFAGLTVGNLTVKFDYNIATDTATWSSSDSNDGDYAITFTGKTDSGELHLGYMSRSSDRYLADLGGSFAIGDMSVKVDLWKENSLTNANAIGTWANDGGYQSDVGIAAPGLAFQADFGIGNTNFVLFFNNPNADVNNTLGLKLNYKMDKLTIGGEYFQNYTAAGLDAWQIYGLYNVGAYDVKIGLLDMGSADDTALILGFHAGIW